MGRTCIKDLFFSYISDNLNQTSHWCNGVIRKHARIRLDCKKIIIVFQFTIANKSWSTVYKSIILICWRLEVTPPPNHPTIQTSKIQKNLQSYISSQQWPFWLTPIIYIKGNSILLLYIFWTKNALQSSLPPPSLTICGSCRSWHTLRAAGWECPSPPHTDSSTPPGC